MAARKYGKTTTIRLPGQWIASIVNIKQCLSREHWDRVTDELETLSRTLPRVAPLYCDGTPRLTHDGGPKTHTVRICEKWAQPLTALKFCDHASVAKELVRIDMAIRFLPAAKYLPVARVQQVDPAVQLAPAKPVTQTATLAATGTDGLGGNFRAIAESQEEYPVDFDDAWEWVYESKKSNAKRALVKDFIEGVDYVTVLLNSEQNLQDCYGGRPPEKIYLTVDCFKQFCMMAGTPRGRQVRLHYLEIERKFKAAQAALSTTGSHNALSKVLEGEIGRIHAKLDAVIDGTARFNAWATKTDKTAEQRHVEVITKMDTLSTKAERANFSSKTEKLAIECLVEEFQGRCPITDRIIVDKNGKYLDLDLHHIDGVSSNRSPSNCCPLSKEGHQAFHGNSTDLQMNSQIKAWQVRFQMFLARKETPLLIGLMQDKLLS